MALNFALKNATDVLYPKSNIDMHRELGRKWTEMNKELSSDMKISQHPAYISTYEKMLVKNQIAQEIYQEVHKYIPALDANNIGLEHLQNSSQAYENFTRTKKYFEHINEGRADEANKLASEIYQNIKDHHGSLGYLSIKNKQNFSETINDLKINASKYELSQKASQLNIDWKNDKYKNEWDKLRELAKNESSVEILVKFYDIVCTKTYPTDIKRIYGRMNDLIEEIGKRKILFRKICEAAPHLGKVFNKYIKTQEVTREKNRGRDK